MWRRSVECAFTRRRTERRAAHLERRSIDAYGEGPVYSVRLKHVFACEWSQCIGREAHRNFFDGCEGRPVVLACDGAENFLRDHAAVVAVGHDDCALAAVRKRDRESAEPGIGSAVTESRPAGARANAESKSVRTGLEGEHLLGHRFRKNAVRLAAERSLHFDQET